MDMKLELVPVPVADVERTKAFYVEKVGFHLDHDVQPSDTMRVVQMTPPGSACSIVIPLTLPISKPARSRSMTIPPTAGGAARTPSRLAAADWSRPWTIIWPSAG